MAAVTSGEELLETEPNYEHFNEDENNERIMNIIKEKKSSMLGKWIRRLFPSKDDFSPQPLTDEEYLAKANEAYENVASLLTSNEWRDHRKGQNGDVVKYINHEKFGKVFLLTSIVNCPAEYLFEDIHNKLDKVSEWNPTILDSKYIRRLNDHVDLTYQVTAGGGGGAVKPRDFVMIRCDKAKGDQFISAGCSIEHPDYPPTKYMRGENKIGAWCTQNVAKKNPQDPVQCCFQWILGVDLKGWIPQYVVDIAIPTAMLDFMLYLRVFLDKKREAKEF